MNKTFFKKQLLYKNNKKPSLYLISPEKFKLYDFYQELEKVFFTNAISIFQLRQKNVTENELINNIKELFPLCRKNGVLFILNDNPNLVKIFDLDGVHIGEKDLNISKCRKLIGKNKIIGKSCYNSPNLALKAQNSGANYIAFGAFFKTETKKTFKKVNKNQIKNWKNFKSVPVVGIGGINMFNFKQISQISLDFYAISSSVWSSKLDSLTYIKKFKNTIDNY